MEASTIKFRLHKGARIAQVFISGHGTHQLDWPEMSVVEERTLAGGMHLTVMHVGDDEYGCVLTTDNGTVTIFEGPLEYCGESRSLTP